MKSPTINTSPTNTNNNNNIILSSSPTSSYNSSYGSASSQKLLNCSNGSITSQVPGGVVTTQNMSTVIRPKSNNNSLQFVKIQAPELSKKAVEQIRIAEETKVSKEKIKEVEEEWQNNLLEWKSKRRQQFTTTFEQEPCELTHISENHLNGRKIKTFAEMMQERAKSGNRLSYNLQHYMGTTDDEADDMRSDEQLRYSKEIAQSNYHDRRNEDHTLDQVDHCHDSSVEINLNDNRALDQQDIDRSKTKEVSTKNEDSDNSVFEEDCEEEEEEEQRHLQRVAFEEKLKAFEKLTKPNTRPAQEDRNKTVLSMRGPAPNIPSPIIPQQREQSNQGINSSPHRQEDRDKTVLSMSDAAPDKPSPIIPQQPEQSDQGLQSSPHRQEDPDNTVLSMSDAAPDIPSPIIPQQRQQSNQGLHSTPHRQEDPDNTVLSMSDAAPDIPSPIILQQRQQSNQGLHSSSPHRQEDLDKTVLSMNDAAPGIPSPIIPQQREQFNQGIHSSSHRQEDRDKTVLSISGKKRCSSCREELGRGAAAFVVESLSLVYHTNCFRCSVCHVNLSNGFRGVDVRVHAGALHCQNCYSKDGLNYSRV